MDAMGYLIACNYQVSEDSEKSQEHVNMYQPVHVHHIENRLQYL